MEFIRSKTILSRVKDDSYFGLSYNMNLYRGCQHGCIYCDSRSACYKMDDLSKIYAKENAIELLARELKSKRHKGTISFGSINDPYMPVEKKLQLTRRALKLITERRFPVHIITKSNLVIRDIDLLQKLNNVYNAVSFSITTADDELAAKTEPNSATPSERLAALSKLRDASIYAGIIMTPVLPFINDVPKHVMDLVDKAKDAGAQYILAWFGVTLRTGSREYFYRKLDRHFPGIKEKYIKAFGNSYACNSPRANELYQLFYERCQKHNIPTKMIFYEPEENGQLSLF